MGKVDLDDVLGDVEVSVEQELWRLVKVQEDLRADALLHTLICGVHLFQAT